jgi:hypothetical protein
MRIKSKKGFTFLFSALLIMMLMFSTSATVFAAGSIQSADYWTGIAEQLIAKGGIDTPAKLATQLSIVAGNSTYNDAGTRYPVVVVSDGSNKYVDGQAPDATISASISSTNYSNLPIPDLNGANNAKLSGVIVMYYTKADAQSLSKVQANISAGLLSQAGVTPDTGTAMNLISGIMPMVNTLLGLIVVVISIGMTIFSALDIIYLAFPAFRSKIDEQIEGGGKGTKQNKNGTTSSKWVTDDAVVAVKETLEDGLQPWGAYFKRRVLAYIFLAVILFILLTGNIFAITTLVTNALQGLFSSLGIG